MNRHLAQAIIGAAVGAIVAGVCIALGLGQFPMMAISLGIAVLIGVPNGRKDGDGK